MSDIFPPTFLKKCPYQSAGKTQQLQGNGVWVPCPGSQLSSGYSEVSKLSFCGMFESSCPKKAGLRKNQTPWVKNSMGFWIKSIHVYHVYIIISKKRIKLTSSMVLFFDLKISETSEWRSVESSPNLWDSWSPRNLLREKYDNKFGAWKDLRKALNISGILKFSCYLEVFHFYVLNYKNQIDSDWIFAIVTETPVLCKLNLA